MTYSVEWQRAYGKSASMPDEGAPILMWNPKHDPDPKVGEYSQGMWKGVKWPPTLWAYINLPTLKERQVLYRFENFGEDVWIDGFEPQQIGQSIYVLTNDDEYARATYEVGQSGGKWFVLEDGSKLPPYEYAWTPRNPNQDGLLP